MEIEQCDILHTLSLWISHKPMHNNQALLAATIASFFMFVPISRTPVLEVCWVAVCACRISANHSGLNEFP